MNRSLALVGTAAVVTVGLLRSAVLYAPGSPSGIDGGNWLAFGTFTREGMVYPPLVPMVFAWLATGIGPVLATTVAGASSTVAPALAVLGTLAWAGRPVAGALTALAVVSSGAIGEAAAWGGYPQSIATATAIVSLTALTAWIAYGSGAGLAVFAATFAAVVATSHLIAVPATASALLVVGAGLVSARGATFRRAAVATTLTVVPYVLLAPTYAALLSTAAPSGTGQAGDIERVLGVAWPAYLLLLLLVPGAFVIATRKAGILGAVGPRDRCVLGAAAAAATVWGLAYAVTLEPRLLHDIVVVALLGAGAVAAIIRPVLGARSHALLGVAGVAGVLVIAATGLAAFPAQVSYYRVLAS